MAAARGFARIANRARRAGPDQDWKTLSGLDSHVDVYAAQFRVLEAEIRRLANGPSHRADRNWARDAGATLTLSGSSVAWVPLCFPGWLHDSTT